MCQLLSKALFVQGLFFLLEFVLMLHVVTSTIETNF